MTSAVASSDMSSASVSRSASIHFWRFPERTVALNWRLATLSVTNGPTIDAVRAVQADTKLRSVALSIAVEGVSPADRGHEPGRERKARQAATFVPNLS